MVKVLNFKVIVEQDEDGRFVASVPSVPGCYSDGKTYEEAVKNIKEAVTLSLEVAKNNSNYSGRIVFPQNNKEKEKFIGLIDLPIKFAC